MAAVLVRIRAFVVAHKTDFRGGKPTVTREQYLGLLDDIVAAYCGTSCS